MYLLGRYGGADKVQVFLGQVGTTLHRHLESAATIALAIGVDHRRLHGYRR